MNKTIYLCEDNLENILTAVYYAWASKKGHSNVRLQLQQDAIMEPFCDYILVKTEPDKVDMVNRSIDHKISHEVWQMIHRAAMSWDPAKANAIYRFLVGGFHYGKKVTQMLTEPAVQKIYELNRQVSNESHFFKEFVRFDAMDNHVLLSKIRPKSNVLPIIAPHFANRLSGENFMILDVERNLAAIHPAEKQWFLTSLTEEDINTVLSPDADVYRDLWKVFEHYPSIEAQKHSICS